jgi:FtsZ-binding cell division protein ZapB
LNRNCFEAVLMKNTRRTLGVNWHSYHNEREKWMDATFHCIASVLEAWIQTWKPKKTLSFQSTNYNTNMSRNRGNWGRLRPWSFCYCDTSISVSNVAVDTIWQLQAALDEEQTMMATLCQERDEAQNSSWIWERDLSILYGDHRHLQASLNRLILQFNNLQARI